VQESIEIIQSWPAPTPAASVFLERAPGNHCFRLDQPDRNNQRQATSTRD